MSKQFISIAKLLKGKGMIKLMTICSAFSSKEEKELSLHITKKQKRVIAKNCF